MKKKKILSLSLNKQKISKLNCKQQDVIRGGATCIPCVRTHCDNECAEPSIVRECIWSEGTDDLTNEQFFR